MGSPSTIAPHRIANAGTMNVTVLAAVAVVRPSTRKYSGQARAVEITATPISEATPPDRRDAGRAGQRGEREQEDRCRDELARRDLDPGDAVRRRRTNVPAKA